MNELFNPMCDSDRDVIPHAAESLREIEVTAALLDRSERLEFLQHTYDWWSELYSKYLETYPLEDPSDFLLMVTGIRRLMERNRRA